MKIHAKRPIRYVGTVAIMVCTNLMMHAPAVARDDLEVGLSNGYNQFGWAIWASALPSGVATCATPMLSGDFNGDGKTDIVRFTIPTSGSAPSDILVGISNGNGFNNFIRWATWWTSKDIKVLAGDFNGDGRTDVMKFDVPASGSALAGLWVGLSDGTRFNTTQWATWWTSKDIKVLAGDFNGDGLTDVMKFDVPASGSAPAGLWVGLSDGTRFNTTQWATLSTGKEIEVLADDFNGDRKTDVAELYITSSTIVEPSPVLVGLSNTANNGFSTAQWGNVMVDSPSLYRTQFLSGDFDGNGLRDVMVCEIYGADRF